MGLCNNPDRLDPALVRPGRFDRHVAVTLPGVPDLAGILKVCCRPDLQRDDLMPIAVRLAGSSAAEVASLVRDAKRIARGQNRPLEIADLEAAMVDHRPALPDRLRWRIALHEAGHAVIGHGAALRVSHLQLGGEAGIGGLAGAPRRAAGGHAGRRSSAR